MEWRGALKLQGCDKIDAGILTALEHRFRATLGGQKGRTDAECARPCGTFKKIATYQIIK
jgi:hypothetical protein